MELSRPDITTLAALVAEEVRANILASLSPDRWLTLHEAMDYARVKSPNTVRAWIDNGYIYAHKRSGQWIVDCESIDDWFLSEKVS
jgi:hypothetical protein